MENQNNIYSNIEIPITNNESILKTNKNISDIKKIKELINKLEKSSLNIIIPIMKLQKKIKIKLKEYTQNYYELKTKSENALKEMNPDNNSINNLNITDIQLNQKYANEHEELIHFYDKIINKIDLFTELIKNENFEKILNYFEIIFKDCNNDYFDNTDLKDLEKLDEKIKLKNRKNKDDLNNILNKKKIKKKIITNKSISSKIKDLNSFNRRRKQDLDLLEFLQKSFPTSNYVQKISKTFLRRRLFKNVIYRHNFEYKTDGGYFDEKIRSSGESTIYKFGKFTFTFINDDIFNKNSNFDKLENFFSKNFKQYFKLIDINNKKLIFAGKINLLINDLLKNVFENEILIKEFSVKFVVIEFYEFYEELISEFIPENLNENLRKKYLTRINFDEKNYKHLVDDWHSLQEVRKFVEKCKKEGIR